MVATNAVVTWLVAAMMAWSPVNRKHLIADAQETVEDATSRYYGIAEAAMKVSFDTSHAPIIRTSEKRDQSRSSSALLVLSVAFFESGFRKDIDLGVGRMARGDSGKSWCLMQVNVGNNRTSTSTLEHYIGRSWSGDDLVSDHVKCLTAGYEIMAKSFASCHSAPLLQRLAQYASGKCEDGLAESEVRVGKAMRWYDHHHAPNTDTEVLAELHEAPGGASPQASAGTM